MKMVNRLIASGALVLMNAACTTTQFNDLSHEESGALSGKTVVIAKYSELPDFPARTAANVQFGAFGQGKATASGNAMIRANEIVDPALQISRVLAQGLSENYGVEVVEQDYAAPVTTDLSGLLRLYQSYDVILDVKTQLWGGLYYVSDWNNYRVFYIAQARLIDTQSKAVLFEVECTSEPIYENTENAPTYEDLESGGALEKELDRSIAYCIDYIRDSAKLHYQTAAQP